MGKVKQWFLQEEKRNIIFAAVSGISLVLSLSGWLRNSIIFDVSWVAIILCGIPIIIGAIKGLVFNHDIKADVLVSMALIASIFIKEYFAAGEVAFIMAIGTLLENGTARKTRQGINKLIKLSPKTARIRRNGTEDIIPAEQVVLDDTLIVLAGETIPVDGVILYGNTSIDLSVMTGESMPVDKTVGDDVTSGTVNQFGTFEMRAAKVGKDSSLQRMIKLAEEADAKKAPIVSLTDKWATWMVVAALTISVLCGVITGDLIRAVTVLIVFCPCAFILATPTAIMAGIGNATKYGILIRSGDGLERLSKIKYMAFDKTGTLTYGKPKVVAVRSLNPEISNEELLEITALAEQRSEHPLGRAVLQDYINQGGALREIKDFSLIAGKGVRAIVDGKNVISGKEDLMQEERIELSIEELTLAKEYLNKGATVIYTSVEGKISGFIALADTIRNDAKNMIEELKKIGIEPILLTGDNEYAAKNIASQVGIQNLKSNLLPEDKMKIIEEYGKNKENICMIGDGINDSLALSTAYAGVAMGGVGSDIAVESSDAVLVSDDIQRIPYLIKISQMTMKKINFNIAFSMCLNLLAVILAITGILNPIFGALVHNFGSVAVVINSALLLTVKDK